MLAQVVGPPPKRVYTQRKHQNRRRPRKQRKEKLKWNKT